MDLFELRVNHFLLVDDYSLKWPEVAKLESLSSKCVITRVKSMISKYGNQDIIISHNGPQLTCYGFKEFVEAFYITHTTTSPYHAKSNWQTERMVQTMKRQQITRSIFSAFRVSEHQDWWYWHVSSPANFGTQSILPTTVLLLKSCVHGNTFVKMKCQQEKQEENFNRHAKISESRRPKNDAEPIKTMEKRIR